MKNVIKKTLKWIIPPIINKCFKFIKLILRRFRKTDRLVSYEPENIDTLIIMGNGPSLSKSIEKYGGIIKSSPTMAVNFFANSDLYTEIKPNYYVLVDPAFFYDKDKLSSSIKTNNKKLIDQINSLTDWNMVLFIAEAARGSELINNIKNKNVKIVFFSYEPVDENLFSLKERFFLYKHDLALVPSQNVLNTCIGIAIFYHFKNIYLIGADTSGHELYSIDQNNNELIIVDHHFYGKEVRHMYKDASETVLFTGTDAFTAMAKVLNNYLLLREYAKKEGLNIYNASEYSWIDAYERKKLDSIK